MQTMPVVNGLEEEYGSRLQVVRLNFNDPRNDDVMTTLAIRGHPTIVLVNGEGEVARTWFGAATADDLRPLIDELLAADERSAG